MSQVVANVLNAYRGKTCDPVRTRKLLPGELHPGCASYCGPGTRIDLPEVRNFPPYNDVDAICREHDLNYEHSSKLPQQEAEIYRRKSDNWMMEQLKKFPQQELHDLAKATISGKVAVEDLVPRWARWIAPRHTGRKLGGVYGAQMPISPEHILESKPYPLGYTKEIVQNIILIAHNPEEARPFGSYLYRSQPYPGDIDLFEGDIPVCKGKCSDDQADKSASKIFKDVILRVAKTKGVYLGDIKLGKDVELYIVLTAEKGISGNLRYTTLPPDRDFKKVQLKEFDIEHNKKVIDYVLSEDLISKESHKELYQILDNDDYPFLKLSKFFEKIRQLLTLRWSFKEIQQGYKLLGNSKFTMEEAFGDYFLTDTGEKEHPIHSVDRTTSIKYEKSVQDKEQDIPLAKIDMWTPIQGKFIELTNLMTFTYLGPDNKRKELTYGHNNIRDDLKGEIAKYYWNPLFDKPMKYAKRIFSLARFNNDLPVARKMMDLFHSDINMLNMINSHVDTLESMVRRIAKPPLAEIRKQIEEMKTLVVKIINIKDFDYQHYLEVLDGLTKMNKKDLAEGLHSVHEEFGEIIKERVREWLIKEKLYPAPKAYLDPEHYPISLY